MRLGQLTKSLNLNAAQVTDDGAGSGLLRFGADAVPPRDIAELRDRLGDIPGTDLAGLIARLSPDAETAEQTLCDIIAQDQEIRQTLRDISAQARELAAAPDPGEPS